MAETGRYRKAALDAANEVRSALGLKPVKKLYPGLRRTPSACAITATVLDDDFDTDKYCVRTYGPIEVYDKITYASIYLFPSIDDVAEFICRFDSGQYPDLATSELTPIMEKNRDGLTPAPR